VDLQVHVLSQPLGTSLITTPTTVGSSGIFGAPAAGYVNGSIPFKFPNAGTFTYMCRVHDHMVGTVVVKS
jgi:plastocyanin